MTNSTRTLPVAFDDVGRGEPALVYLTGWASSRDVYAATVERTARHRRCIAIDWRGHGTSPSPTGDFGTADCAEDVLAVLDRAGIERYVLVTGSHAGWVARDLLARDPERIAGALWIAWLVLGAPAPFLAGLRTMADLTTTRTAVEGLTGSWLSGHENVPGLAEHIASMRAHDDAMWARAAREISTGYATHSSPLAAYDAMPRTIPVRHLYAEPADEAYLAAQQAYAAGHPWFTVRKLAGAASHFPTLEAPDEIATEIERFVADIAM